MKRVQHWWQRVPRTVRKPLVFITGSLFILTAAAIGWLPGPGGIPLFLIGVAILATEFVWATRFRDGILVVIARVARWHKQHKAVGTILILCCAAISITSAYFFLR